MQPMERLGVSTEGRVRGGTMERRVRGGSVGGVKGEEKGEGWESDVSPCRKRAKYSWSDRGGSQRSESF